jgi:tetratricopeptide (TPR) repeat protein
MHAADWRSWSVLGDALAAGPVAERLQARRKEAELAPAEPVALYELARDLARAGEPQEAAAHALQLLRIAPFAPQTHETVALVAMKLGICADALRAQQRAIDTLSDQASPQARAEREQVLADYQRQCAAPPSP